MSDTPRTNKESFFPHDSKYKVCDAGFARILERELNAANDHIKRLEEAGDWMRHHSNNDWWCEKWDKAKEDKL